MPRIPSSLKSSATSATHTTCPGLYTKVVNEETGDRCVIPLYVDDLRVYYDEGAREVATADMDKMAEKFGIKFGVESPPTDYFLGGDRVAHGHHD